jgi:hypothetical protein
LSTHRRATGSNGPELIAFAARRFQENDEKQSQMNKNGAV